MDKNSTMKDLKKRVKLLKINFYLMAVCIFLLLITISLMTRYFVYDPPIQNGMKIKYVGLNASDIDMVNKLIEDVDYPYLMFAETITFSKNFDDSCDWFCRRTCKSNSCLGLNRAGKTIIVEVNDEETTRGTLCHELMHAFVLGKNDYKHYVVEDLATKGVCYK